MRTGIGDDLFEAFFADDEPEKKKPAPVIVEATSAAPVEPAKPAVKKTTTKKTITKKTPIKKATTAAPQKEQSETIEKEKPQFPHTPALLELAQQNAADKENAEKNGDSTEKNGGESTEKVNFKINGGIENLKIFTHFF